MINTLNVLCWNNIETINAHFDFMISCVMGLIGRVKVTLLVQIGCDHLSHYRASIMQAGLCALRCQTGFHLRSSGLPAGATPVGSHFTWCTILWHYSNRGSICKCHFPQNYSSHVFLRVLMTICKNSNQHVPAAPKMNVFWIRSIWLIEWRIK